MSTKKRIYVPITADMAKESDYVLINGVASYDPRPTDHKYDEYAIEYLQKNGYTVDYSKSLVGGDAMIENGRIDLVLTLNDVAEAPATQEINIGVSEGHLFLGETDLPNVTVGGTFGDATLGYIGNLAALGKYLELVNIHTDATDAKHFNQSAKVVGFRHDNDTLGDKKVSYPKALPTQDNENIRIMDGVNIRLDGHNALNMKLYKGVTVEMSIDTRYCR